MCHRGIEKTDRPDWQSGVYRKPQRICETLAVRERDSRLFLFGGTAHGQGDLVMIPVVPSESAIARSS